MTSWNGYIQFEAINLSQENFDALCAAFAELPPVDPQGNADYEHGRIRLDGLARGFEMKFDAANVTVERFKQFMADLFEVPVEDVEDYVIEDVSYSGGGRLTRVWGFAYPVAGPERLRAYRFGSGGSTHEESRLERTAYLIANAAAWGDTVA
jgi:hypothetical protein